MIDGLVRDRIVNLGDGAQSPKVTLLIPELFPLLSRRSRLTNKLNILAACLHAPGAEPSSRARQW
jgi:hypothetical protein